MDITERKHSEQECEQLLTQLQRERQNLRASQQQLEEKIAELEQFRDVVVGRELKLIALEQELNRRRAQIGPLNKIFLNKGPQALPATTDTCDHPVLPAPRYIDQNRQPTKLSVRNRRDDSRSRRDQTTIGLTGP